VPPPCRGEIWMADFDPTRGHEQAGRRPALIVSANPFHLSRSGMVVLIPLTTKEKRIPLHVPIKPPEGGLKSMSYIRCEDVRAASQERLIRRMGVVSDQTMSEVETRLRLLLEL
jgi:mRNA interferase MazF